MSNCFFITTGDLEGVGSKILLKSLKSLSKDSTQYIIWGSESQIFDYIDFVNSNIEDRLEDERLFAKKAQINSIENLKKTLSDESFKHCKYLFLESYLPPAIWFSKSVEILKGDLFSQRVHGIVTGPLSKAEFHKSGLNCSGHTEYLRSVFTDLFLPMLFVSKEMKLLLYSDHISLFDLKAQMKNTTHLKKFFTLAIDSFKDKKIGWIGINPHAGENGLIGKDEIEIIMPTIKELSSKAIILEPFSADSFFKSKNFDDIGCWISFYHDQILPLYKYLSKNRGYQTTLGLPFIRTSVEHGTATGVSYTEAKNDSFLSAVRGAHEQIKGKF